MAAGLGATLGRPAACLRPRPGGPMAGGEALGAAGGRSRGGGPRAARGVHGAGVAGGGRRATDVERRWGGGPGAKSDGS